MVTLVGLPPLLQVCSTVARAFLLRAGGGCWALGDQVGGCALEDDSAAVVAGARAEVDDPVGARHHRLMVCDHDDRFAGVDEAVEQAEELLDVGKVETGGRLVEDVDRRPCRPYAWPA